MDRPEVKFQLEERLALYFVGLQKVRTSTKVLFHAICRVTVKVPFCAASTHRHGPHVRDPLFERRSVRRFLLRFTRREAHAVSTRYRRDR